jgi:TorA maturation chaperone TorD
VDIEEFVSREKLRGDSFRLLAACFYQPQRDIFQEGLLHNLAESLKKLCPGAADYAQEMIKLLQVYSDEELLVDYSRLFIGPSELLAAPYGSVYLEEERRLMGDSTMAAIDFYKSRGLVIDTDFKEVPDHVAVELEFMYYLVFKEIEAIEAGNMTAAAAAVESQEIFLNNFLRSWADKFAGKMAEGAETGFYRALAGCFSAFVYKTDIPESLPETLKASAVS